VGSFLGKTPFYPAISPKKTWEGTIGGIVFTMVLAFVWGINTDWFPISFWILMGLVASLIGTIGDLVESKLKRMAAIKDSGSLMPGHGGALDRFDSLLLSAPFAFFLSILFEICKQMNFF
jgi:phosphatidate cytidylyltransferase